MRVQALKKSNGNKNKRKNIKNKLRKRNMKILIKEIRKKVNLIRKKFKMTIEEETNQDLGIDLNTIEEDQTVEIIKEITEKDLRVEKREKTKRERKEEGQSQRAHLIHLLFYLSEIKLLLTKKLNKLINFLIKMFQNQQLQ